MKNIGKDLKFIGDLVEYAINSSLSDLLPKLVVAAKHFDDLEFASWIQLENGGYFYSNSALSKSTVVPGYRMVAGQYQDRFGRPFMIDSPGFSEINNYPIRESVSELEIMAARDGVLSLTNPLAIDLIREKFGVSVSTFSFPAVSLNAILSEIRHKILEWLLQVQKKLSGGISQDDSGNMLSVDLINLHPTVQKVASRLFIDGHYRQAILDTYIALVESVKIKSGRYDLDNSPLMQEVFSPKKPRLVVSEMGDEQLGFMWLFSGAIMGIRNPKAHRLVDIGGPQRTLEWLSFASALFRILDDSEIRKEIN